MSISDYVPWGKSGKKLPVTTSKNPISTLQDEINRIFDGFFSVAPTLSGWGLRDIEDRWAGFAPSIDVEEDASKVSVTAELPGIKEEDIDISLAKRLLTIRGEKKEERKEEDKNRRHTIIERSFGSFERTVQLPCDIEEDKVDASFKNGVLTVILPKTQEARKETKKVSVRKG